MELDKKENQFPPFQDQFGFVVRMILQYISLRSLIGNQELMRKNNESFCKNRKIKKYT